ncbi:MAG TPA: O-antigen ligase family protein [Acidimicrobiia bacterium]|nr:O-antigen ligase family protein [Acidimicrobiia bacterium]
MTVITHHEVEKSALDSKTERRKRLGIRLVCVWAFLLSVQLPAFTEGQNLSLALSDLVLVVGILATFSSLRLRAKSWSVWHFAMPISLAASAMFVGPLTRYTVANKVVGLVVLVVTYAFVTSHVWSWEDVARVVRAFVGGMVFFTLLGIIRYVLSIEIPFTYCQTCDVRLIAFMPDPNLYGSLLVVALAAFVALDGSRVRLLPAALRWPSVLTLVAALALSSSRSAWLALGAVVLVALITRRRTALPALVGSIGAVLLVGFLIAPERVLDFAQLAGRTYTIDSRFTLMEQGMDAFLDNPLFGIGLGNSHELFGQIIHNTLLWTAAELGVIGLIVFAGFLIWIARRLGEAFWAARAVHRPLVSFLIMGNAAMLAFSLSVEAFYQRHWWMLFALTACASAVATRDDPRSATTEPAFQSA